MDLFAHADMYPASPGFKRTDTSKAAAQSVAASAPRLRQLVLDQLRLYGPATADEIAENMGRDRLSIRPRLSELRELGKVQDSGRRSANSSGKTAIVWELAA